MRTGLTFPNNPTGTPAVPGPLVAPNIRARTRQLPRIVRSNTSGTIAFPKISIAGPLVAVNTRPRLKQLPIVRRPESGQAPFALHQGPLVAPNIRKRVFPNLRVRPRQAQVVPVNSTTGPLVVPNVRVRLKWLPIVRRPQFTPVPPETLSTTGPLIPPNVRRRVFLGIRITPRVSQTVPVPVTPSAFVAPNVRARIKALPIVRRSRWDQPPVAVPTVPAPNIRHRVFALLRPVPRQAQVVPIPGQAGTGPLVPVNTRPQIHFPRIPRRTPLGTAHLSRPGFVRPNIGFRVRPMPRTARHLGVDGFFPAAPAVVPTFIQSNSRPRVTLNQRVIRRPNTSGQAPFPTIGPPIPLFGAFYFGQSYFAGGLVQRLPTIPQLPPQGASIAPRRRLLIPARPRRGSEAPVLPSNLAFTKLAPTGGPPTPAFVFGMTLDLAADATGKTLIVVGGDTAGGAATAIAQQWHYTEPGGTPTWASISSANTPWGLNSASGIADLDLIYDPTSGAVIGFGGTAYGASQFSTTLSWSGTNWSLLSPGTVPAARTEYTLEADPVTGQPFMVCGWPNSPFSNMLSDHYTWSGTNWTAFGGTKPTARSGYGMATDTSRGITVLFGGHNGTNGSPYSTVLSDTWIWNGTSWSNPTPATTPTARYYPQMYYDSFLRMVVLYGGAPVTTGNLSDAWGWNGANWVKINLDLPCEMQYGGQIVGVPNLGHAIGFGGIPSQNVTTFAQTWRVKAETPTAGPSVVQYMATTGPSPLGFILQPTQ